MNVLVTGGAGYIGSHACKALARAGYTPVCYDDLTAGHRWAVRWGPLETGALEDGERLREVIRRYRPEAVMHFAALAEVAVAVADPARAYRTNVAGTLNLLEVMREAGVDQLVLSSTCAVYGVPGTVPIPETHPQRPINPYGASKATIERMLADFDGAYGLRSIALRYFNAAGADPDAEIGEAHEPETHLIPLVLEAAAGEGGAITVHGQDYDTPDGTCIRDYIHVSDLAEAHVAALQALEHGASSAAYNLGNGRGFSVREVIAAAEAVTGCAVAVEHGPRRPGDPPRLVGDATAAVRDLGWQSAWTDLEAIIATAWQWMQRRQGGRQRSLE